MKTFSHSTKTTSEFTSRGGIPTYAPQCCAVSQTRLAGIIRTPARWWLIPLARIGCMAQEFRRVCVAIFNRWPEPPAQQKSNHQI